MHNRHQVINFYSSYNVKMSNISVWGNFINGEYNDRKIYEDEDIIIVRYCGQRCGKNDKFIGPGNRFFAKNSKKDYYKFIGNIIFSKLIGTERQLHNGEYKDINIFRIVISKEEVQFRVKLDAYDYFGLEKKGQDFMSGIINHAVVTVN